ncbi:MAG: PilZ domain-containing protein [Azonexus sp.]
MNISRRRTERVPLCASSFQATWLSDWQKIDETGELINISPDGFGGRLNRAPAVGHLFHARLSLSVPDGETRSLPIEVDAHLCRRQRPDEQNAGDTTWIIHCAIESIRPTDQRRLLRAIGIDQPQGS